MAIIHLRPGDEAWLEPPNGPRSLLWLADDGQVHIDHGGNAPTVPVHGNLGEPIVGNDMADGRRRAKDWEIHRHLEHSRYREDVMGWSTNPPATIAEAVGQALGAASTYFENGVPSGVFDGRRASLIADALLDQIEKYGQRRVEQEREKQAFIKQSLRSATLSFDMKDLGKENLDAVMGQVPTRFEVKIVPNAGDLVVNEIRVGSLTMRSNGSVMVSTRAGGTVRANSIAEAVQMAVEAAVPPGADGVAPGDIRIDWSLPELTVPEGGSEDDEPEY